MSKAKRRKQENGRREFATKCPHCLGWGVHGNYPQGWTCQYMAAVTPKALAS
jgi:hypothetical protein